MNKLANNLIPNLFKSRTILLDILHDRGFNINDYANSSINEIGKLYANKQLDMVMEDDGGKKIYIKYHLATKLKPKDIFELTDDLFNLENILSKDDELIIITKDKANDTLIKLMRTEYKVNKIYFNIFSISSLLYNILKHNMVPKHKIIYDDDVAAVMKEYNLATKASFPEIDRFDRVAKLIGLRPGDVVEITRPSRTSISAKYYRLCY